MFGTMENSVKYPIFFEITNVFFFFTYKAPLILWPVINLPVVYPNNV